MRKRNTALKIFTMVAIVTGATAWATIKSTARQTQFVERALNFSAIGMIKGQTARLHGLVVGPCNIPVEFIFLDKDGRVLKQATQEIEPEHIESFDLNFDSLGRPEELPDHRLQLRMLVKYRAHAEHADQERVLAALEIFDNKTGKTTFGMSVPEPPECPAPVR